jgi:hypothetical protein
MVAPSTPSRAARASQEGRVYQKGSFFGESALIGPGVRKETIFAGSLEGRGFNDNRSPVAGEKLWPCKCFITLDVSRKQFWFCKGVH